MEQAWRVAAAVIGLQPALVAVTRQPSSADVARVATAVGELDAAVDGLSIEVTTAVPPYPGHGARAVAVPCARWQPCACRTGVGVGP